MTPDRYGDFGEGRPPGLRRRTIRDGSRWWRIESDDPAKWEWSGFPTPRNRFDPASGAFRTRYAAASLHGAARERYSSTGRYIPSDHAAQHLVHLVGVRPLRVLDLRTEANLDALGIDDRMSTGREDQVLGACHRLVECCRGWWPDLDGVVYRSRTTPETSANLAFFGSGAFRVESRRLDTCAVELDDLVLRHEFTIGFGYGMSSE